MKKLKLREINSMFHGYLAGKRRSCDLNLGHSNKILHELVNILITKKDLPISSSCFSMAHTGLPRTESYPVYYWVARFNIINKPQFLPSVH